MSDLKTVISGDSSGAERAMNRTAAGADKLKKNLNLGGAISGELGQLTNRLPIVGDLLQGMGTKAVVGVGGVLALTYALKKYADMVDDIDDNALKMGVTPEYYQQIVGAAAQADASADDIAAAYEKMAIAVEMPTEKTKKAFDMIGDSIENYKGMAPSEMFEAVGKKIAAIEDPALRSAAATRILGGTTLLPLLEDLDRLKAGVNTLDESAMNLGRNLDKTFKAGGQGIKNAFNEAANIAGNLWQAAADMSVGVDGNTNAISVHNEQARAEKKKKDGIKAAADEKKKEDNEAFALEYKHKAELAKISGDTAGEATNNRIASMGKDEIAKQGGGDLAYGLAKIEAEEKAKENSAKKELEGIKEKEKAEMQMHNAIADFINKKAEKEKELKEKRIKGLEEIGKKESEIADKKLAIENRLNGAKLENFNLTHKDKLGKLGLDSSDNINDILSGKTVNKNSLLDKQLAEKIGKAKDGEKVKFTSKDKAEIRRFETNDKNNMIERAKLEGIDLSKDKGKSLQRLTMDYNVKKAEKENEPTVKAVGKVEDEIKKLNATFANIKTV
jgi:hypothetical protein